AGKHAGLAEGLEGQTGSVTSLARIPGPAPVPAPLPPTQLTVGPEKTSSSAPRMFPEFTSPLNACTWSLIELNVNVSCAVSATFKTEYAQLYGLPILVGL